MSDLTPLNDDQQLQIEIKEGRITADEVADIWQQTEDLSPQTNINARREIIALRSLAKGRGPIEALAVQFPVFCNMMLRATNETQAALMRDESKFAHLVAGTETIVKELQKVGSITAAFEKLQSDNEWMATQLQFIEDQLEELRGKKRWWQFWKYIPNWRDHEQEDDKLPQEGIPVDDPRAEEARKRTIGSAWAK